MKKFSSTRNIQILALSCLLIVLWGCVPSDTPPQVVVYRHTPSQKRQGISGLTSFPTPRKSMVRTSADINSLLKLDTSKCTQQFPNRYFIAIGVSKYEGLPSLPYVKNDLLIIKKIATCFLGVKDRNLLVLNNPSLGKFRYEFLKFKSKIRQRDAITFFYFSGHGVIDTKGVLHLLMSDSSIATLKILNETSLSIKDLKSELSKIKGEKVAFLDACRIESPWKPAVVEYRPFLRNMAFVFSTSMGQLSNADKSMNFSAFTLALFKMLKEGIKNLDMDDSGYVELKEFIRPLANRLKEISYSNQDPEVMGDKEIPVFPVM